MVISISSEDEFESYNFTTCKTEDGENNFQQCLHSDPIESYPNDITLLHFSLAINKIAYSIYEVMDEFEDLTC